MIDESRYRFLESGRWQEYALRDSGDGWKLEQFGKYTMVRPEPQAIWKRGLSESTWQAADAVFHPTGEESGGHWEFRKPIDDQWPLSYPLEAGRLKFWVKTTPGRHLGVFPEGAAHWDWLSELIIKRLNSRVTEPLHILNLFGYTGLATLAAAAAGAKATHIDASQKSVKWARENQVLSNLGEKPVRWVVEDALKYIKREGKRGIKYAGIILDPPKFGRGPKGEIWELYRSLPALLNACHACLSDEPLFVVITVYAIRASAIHIAQALRDILDGRPGKIETGELVIREQSAGRLLSQAVFARWSRFG